MEMKTISSVQLSQLTILMLMAGYPERNFSALTDKDKEATALLMDGLWGNTPADKRLVVYADLHTCYGETPDCVDIEVPEYVMRLAHIMACRYSPLPDKALLEAESQIGQIKQLVAMLLARHPGKATVITHAEAADFMPFFHVSVTTTEFGAQYTLEERAPTPEEAVEQAEEPGSPKEGSTRLSTLVICGGPLAGCALVLYYGLFHEPIMRLSAWLASTL